MTFLVKSFFGLSVRWYWKPGWASLWQIDETYIRVKGRWMYFYCRYHLSSLYANLV
ncbi:DDE-type integrase/transposase/recombinase [Vibrio parahaemolyticus]|nr:DDE-type integrase/transposase/recombinase [Vibrio parahaemolyticus]